MKSGFGGFNSLSSVSDGKKTIVDSYGSLSVAIKNIIGDPDAVIFSTAFPNSIIVGSNGLLSTWSALDCSVANVFLSSPASVASSSVTNDYPLGKYPGIYCAGGGQRITGDNGAKFPNVFKKVENFFIYYKYVSYPTINNLATFLFTAGNFSVYSGSNVPGVVYAFNNSLTFRNSAYFGTAAFKTTSITFNHLNRETILGAANSSTFRMYEQIYDSTNRAVTSSFYDENKNLINVTPTAGALTASSNKTSWTFTPTSVGATNDQWDTFFPSSSFAPIFTSQLGSSQADPKISYYTYIKTSTDSPIPADAVRNLKNLLDKVYGA